MEPANNVLSRQVRAIIAGTILTLGSVPLVKAYFSRAEAYATGKLQGVTSRLRDGSELDLFGETRVDVKFSDYERHLDLGQGEIRVDVQKDEDWPFIVHVDRYKVIAVGTNFSVRQRAGNVVVCLFEGKVRLEDPQFLQKRSRKFNLSPGQCVTLAEYGSQIATSEEEAHMWQSGSVTINDKTLSEATGEINRYSSAPVVLERIEGNQRVSGLFSPRNALEFAHLMAGILGLEVRQAEGKIILFKPADRNPPTRVEPANER